MQTDKIVSEFDKKAYQLIRFNIYSFLFEVSTDLDKKGDKILEVAPQIHSDTKVLFQYTKIDTLDINQNSNVTYITDLTKENSGIVSNDSFDIIIGPGVTTGGGIVVGASSLILDNIGNNSIVYGVPGVFIRKRVNGEKIYK